MGKVITAASMSLDGYIAGPDESGFDRLFAWYGNGDQVVETAHPELTWHMTKASAELLRRDIAALGAFVVGRRLFDLTGGWGGSHPFDRPVVVVSHSVPDGWPRPDAPFTFVSDIGAAVARARELAGGRDVGVNGGTIARQCLAAGLLDEIWVALVPLLLGGGTPFFDHVANAPVDLDGPFEIVPDQGVTHLRYRVTARP
ncbi:dihydrofolate reductase family protein [Actinomadura macrotermitis]|uniref:Bacterial bifunctional deaminase-reductase C-terminal domain-containing protein n=1 Tax=Actinomadura macrotermitis TaxID=2585200 RepID=A0A7K0BY09_9ACTN|nr:dihydrofolate reductase family protein [Actinomadura macrotermitis]MQY05742.1 hypothetical protein [Actinomadura macrotermitis]